MTHEERNAKIESYGRAHDLLIDALATVPREMWLYKPAPEKWSVHEVIIHIADSEANSYVRCRRFIAEPGLMVMAYDENKWASALNYHGQSTDDALELFRLLRRSCHELIRALPEHVWSNTIEHPENGTMTFDDWLDTYERHIPVHIAQIQRNLASWRASQEAGVPSA
jgi:hypothetical protein